MIPVSFGPGPKRPRNFIIQVLYAVSSQPGTLGATSMTSEESNEAKTEGKLPGLAMNTLFFYSHRKNSYVLRSQRGRTTGIFSRCHLWRVNFRLYLHSGYFMVVHGLSAGSVWYKGETISHRKDILTY